MSAPDHLLISKVITDQSLREVTQAGVKSIFFAGQWGPIFQWVVEYNAKHGAVPSERAFKMAYGDVDIEDTSTETFSGLIDELLVSYRTRTVAAAISDAMGPLDNDDIDGAITALSHGLSSATQTLTRLRDFNIIENWETRLKSYVEMRDKPNALRGVPTGFAGLDRITQGFRPQQLILLVGEAKRGKSLTQLVMAMACHAHGLRPMLISFEMSVDEQLSRFDALSAKVPYARILDGQLTAAELERIKRSMVQRKNMQAFTMSEDITTLTTISALAAKIQEYLPDALYVDGIYLMDDENGEPKGSPAALTNVSRGLKRLAQRFNIPVIGTSQVLSWKVNNKRTRAITADAIGYTSGFAQDADLILGVERNPEYDDRAIIRVVESRSSARAQVHIAWDWNRMTFEEVDEPDGFDISYD